MTSPRELREDERDRRVSVRLIVSFAIQGGEAGRMM